MTLNGHNPSVIRKNGPCPSRDARTHARMHARKTGEGYVGRATQRYDCEKHKWLTLESGLEIRVFPLRLALTDKIGIEIPWKAWSLHRKVCDSFSAPQCFQKDEDANTEQARRFRKVSGREPSENRMYGLSTLTIVEGTSAEKRSYPCSACNYTP